MSSPNISLRNMVCFFFFLLSMKLLDPYFGVLMLRLPYAPTSVDFQGQSFNEKCKLQKNLPSAMPVEKSHAKQLLCVGILCGSEDHTGLIAVVFRAKRRS